MKTEIQQYFIILWLKNHDFMNYILYQATVVFHLIYWNYFINEEI